MDNDLNVAHECVYTGCCCVSAILVIQLIAVSYAEIRLDCVKVHVGV